MQRVLPFTKEKLDRIVAEFPTPFHIYDEQAMIGNSQSLLRSFEWNKGFRQFFAVKATPNPYIMKLLAKVGFGMDCSALAELELSSTIDVSGDRIMFTSNNTPLHEYNRALELGAIINLDDITHLDFLKQHCDLPSLLCFRVNPGPRLGGSEIIGFPEEAKFGLTESQIFDAYGFAKQHGVTQFGIHTMPVSNELDRNAFLKTVSMLIDIAHELYNRFGITLQFLNMGGGIGIPYRPDQSPVDVPRLGAEIRELFATRVDSTPLAGLKLFMECGRYITGPYGYLVTQAIHKKEIYRNYIGVDASMADLMRPGMYGAYHHISVVGKESQPATETYDVVGSLCENNDKFAIQRLLPKVDNGDYLVIHDAGAHGHAMGFNYNGKTRAAELLQRPSGEVIQIRRKETLSDIFSTLDLKGVANFA